MSYLVLARKCRPQTFQEVLGQEHITGVLVNAFKSSRLAHAYIFSGPRGVGKTSTARILARALNCESGPTPTPCNECAVCREIISGSSPSIIEIDGASNNSVEDIRSLREKVGMISTSGRFKVYIIDEVHMLSASAFNALLKTLEEPPPHVKFIFATTEVHKIPLTILSRCQRFDFKRISSDRIVENLKAILTREKISATDKSLGLVAKAADGSMRDALSIFDQILSSYQGEITESEVEALLGLVGREKVEAMAGAVAKGDAASALKQLDAILSRGVSLKNYWQQVMEYFRDVLLLRIGGGKTDLSEEEVTFAEDTLKSLAAEDLTRILKGLAEGLDGFQNSQNPRVMAETTLLKLCDRKLYVGLDEIIMKLKDLEKSLGDSSPPGGNLGKTGGEPPSSPEGSYEPPPAPKKSETAGTGDYQTIYKTLIDRVGSAKKSLPSTLSQGSILELDEKKVVLGFEKTFIKIVDSKDNVKIIQDELEKIINRRVRVEFSELKQPSGNAKNSSGLSRTQENMKAVENDPVLKKFSETFDTRVVQVQKPG